MTLPDHHPSVTPALWERVEVWFHQVADLPANERDRILRSIEESEPETYAWLRTLLAEDEDTHPLLKHPAQAVLQGGPPDATLVGTTIGAFLLKAHLGQGAMGSVFLAERNDGQFKQTVALKLMTPVVHDDTLQQLFNEERTILATLNHPHIARLYDGGFTDSSRAYFTMEYVSGVNLTDYCFQRKLPLEDRLNLFIQVCEAVQFAHRSLIAHLDLKPSNIIVDANGEVKLLDFGVAKLVKSRQMERDDHDTPHRFTLAYAAPEQLRGERPSTSADLYALGTLLFEMLSGSHPLQQHFNDGRALRKSIQHDLPPALAAVRTPDGISLRLLSQDLDAICRKALSKDIAQRYDSVEALLLDLRAYRNAYPVHARPATLRYIAGKFVTRHRRAVAITMTIIALLATVIVYYTQRVTRERDRAVREATRSAEITRLLMDVFTAADPNTGSGDTLTALQLLDQGLDKLETNLRHQPDLLASMLSQLSPIYLNLGRYDLADSIARRALTMSDGLYERPSASLAQALLNVGKVKSVIGEVDTAETLIRDAIMQYTQLNMDEEMEMADALMELSTLYYNKSQFAMSDSIYRVAHTIHLSKLTPPHPDLANDLHNMGTTLRKLGDYEQAEQYLMDALAMKRQLYREPHLEIAYTLNHIGSLRQNTNDWEGAIPFIRSSLTQRKAILGPDHIETIASESNLARTYAHTDHVDSAIYFYEDALARTRSIFPDGHYFVTGLLQSLANTYLGMDDMVRAEQMFRESIALQNKVLAEDDARRAFPLVGLGRVLMKTGRAAPARAPLEDALAIRVRYLPEGHELIGVSQQALGECLLTLTNYPTAIALLESAYVSLGKYPDKYETELDRLLRDLSDACEQNNQPEKAKRYQALMVRH